MPALQMDVSATQAKPSLVPSPDRPSLPSPPLMAQGQGMRLKRLEVELVEPVPRPTDILLGTLNHYTFRVVEAIPVHLEQREEGMVAVWREIDEFGVGKSTSSACEDLGHTLAELYQALDADRDRLGPDLARVWGVLQQHIRYAVRRA